jgi:hypothetical protein
MLLMGQGPPAEPGQPPTFPVEARAVTIDVLALDRRGVPVPDLTAADFTVFEDDQPQAIIAFERRVLRRPIGVVGEPSASEPVMDPVASALTLIVDDLGLNPARDTVAVKKAIVRFLRNDDWPGPITMATSSGEVWWSGVGPQGREDLVSVVGRIKGKRPSPSYFRLGHGGLMTEWQAYRIINDLVDANAEARALALQIYDWWRRGARAVLGTAQALAEGSALWKGRKPIVVFTNGFIRDTTLDEIERAPAAAQDASSVIHFVDVEGLSGDPTYSADSGVSPEPGSLGRAGTELDFVRTAGAEYIAESTGGFAVNTNDLGWALDRIARESSSYYLLGYQPAKSAEGSRHRLRVTVRRPGVALRFRKGYETRLASGRPLPSKSDPDSTRHDPVLLTGVDHDAIPLQVATYLQAAGGAQLLAVIEVDASKISFSSGGRGGGTAVLDLALFGAMRDGPERFRSREQLTLTAAPGASDRLITVRRWEG